MEEISTAISYQEDKRSAKVTTSGSGNYYCTPKCENTHYKVENGVHSNTGIVLSFFLFVWFFFCFPKSASSWKQWWQGISRYSRKGGADKFNVNNALVCEFYLTRVMLTY